MDGMDSLDNIKEHFQFEKINGVMTLIKYLGFEEIVSIPEKYEDEYVLIIGVGAFNSSTMIKEVYLPPKLQIIDNSAFINCTFLEKIYGPNSLRIIKANAFYGCRNIKELVLPESVEIVGERAFDGCTSLKKVVSLNVYTIFESKTFIGSDLDEVSFHLLKALSPYNQMKFIPQYFHQWDELYPQTRTEIIAMSQEIQLKNMLFAQEDEVVIKILLSQNIKFELETINQYLDYYLKLENINIIILLLSYRQENFIRTDIEALNTVEPIAKPVLSELETAWELEHCEGQRIYIRGYIGTNKVRTIPINIEEETIIVDLKSQLNTQFNTLEILNVEAWSESLVLHNHKNLRAVILSKSIIKIDEKAFENCNLLEIIDLPSSVTQIKDRAFWGCVGLKKITLSENLTTIGLQAFANCENIEELIIPDSVTKISATAFENCSGLKRIRLPRNLDKIEHGLFKNCINLEEIILPDFVAEIESLAFSNCTALKLIKFPDDLKSIGFNALENCDKLEFISPHAIGFLDVENKIKFITKYFEIWEQLDDSFKVKVLNSCSDTEFKNKIFLHDDVKIIEEIISKNLTLEIDEINNYIEHHSNLKNTEILEILSNYKKENFTEVQIKLLSAPKEISVIDLKNIWDLYEKNGEIYITNYKGTNRVEIIPETTLEGLKVVEIKSYDLSYSNSKKSYDQLEVVDIKSANTLISFMGSESLREVVLPQNLKTINQDAFKNCIKLEKISIPESVELIEKNSFYNCKSLKSINIPQNLKSIETCAFCGLKSLKSINLPQSLNSINDNTFMGCELLEEITIKSADFIGANAFYDCKSLKSITLPENLTQILSNAFYGCELLEELIIPADVTFIGDDAFKNCTALKNVTFAGDKHNYNTKAFEIGVF